MYTFCMYVIIEKKLTKKKLALYLELLIKQFRENWHLITLRNSLKAHATLLSIQVFL